MDWIQGVVRSDVIITKDITEEFKTKMNDEAERSAMDAL